MTKILLEGLEFFSYHGCFKEEQLIGTYFKIDVILSGDFSIAEKTDNLIHTVNYQKAYQIIKSEMSISSKLIEHVARRIIDRLFDAFHSIEMIHIKVSKINPPLGGKIESVGYIIEENRPK